MTPAPPPDAGHHSASARIVLLAVLAVAFVLTTAWFDGGKDLVPPALWAHPDWMPWWNPPLRMLANAFPGLLLAGVLLAWTRRAGWSFVFAFAVQALLYGVNAVKVRNLAIPLMPADFRLLGQLGSGTGELLSGYLPHVGLLVAGFVVAILVLVFWFRGEAPILPIRPRGPRAAVAILLVAALATLVAGLSFWRTAYDAKRLGMQPWSPMATRQHNGLIGGLVLFHLQFKTQHRKADVRAALALMAQYEPRIAAVMDASASDQDHPDIVVILSESFFAPTIMNGYPPGTDLTPNLHRLERHGTSGRLHVPTFGGGTIRTGFEVLTGLSLRYFPTVQFPYLQIDQERIPGIVRLLAGKGYTTVAVHGNLPGFWNRTIAFKALGFDKFISIGDFPPGDDATDGKYLSDKAFTDEVLRQLPDSGPPRFVFGISIEAHGPYNQDYGIDTRARDAIPVPAALRDPRAKIELQNYIYHMQHADRQLGRLVDTLAKRKRRTLILFFGDHLPAIVPAFQQAGFRNGEGFLEQTPPYLLIDTAHMGKAEQHDTAAWALPGMLLEHAAIHDRWFALTDLIAPKLAALTRAPDAPVAPETPEQKQLDDGMRNVADLRLHGKLDPLWPKATAMVASTRPDAAVPATAATASATHGLQ